MRIRFICWKYNRGFLRSTILVYVPLVKYNYYKNIGYSYISSNSKWLMIIYYVYQILDTTQTPAREIKRIRIKNFIGPVYARVKTTRIARASNVICTREKIPCVRSWAYIPKARVTQCAYNIIIMLKHVRGTRISFKPVVQKPRKPILNPNVTK